MTNQINSLKSISATSLMNNNILNLNHTNKNNRIIGFQIFTDNWTMIRNHKHPHLQAIARQIENSVITSCQSEGKCSMKPSKESKEQLLILNTESLFRRLADHFNTNASINPVILADSASCMTLQQKWDDEALLVIWDKCIVPQLDQIDHPPSSTKDIRAWFLDIKNAHHLESITEVNLSSSKLKTVPLELGKFTNLKMLQLENNQISILPENLFNNHPHLFWLCLDQNKISCLPEKLFEKCPKLEIFSIEDNCISKLPKKLFASSSNLKEVYLRNNQISFLSKSLFKSCPLLNTIDLNNNKIAILPDNISVTCPQLFTLNLVNNPLLFILYKENTKLLKRHLLSKCSEFHSYKCIGPLAAFVKLFASERQNKDKIEGAFKRLDLDDQHLIFEMIFLEANIASNDLHWEDLHALNDRNLVCRAIRRVISKKFDRLSDKEKNNTKIIASILANPVGSNTEEMNVKGSPNVLALIDAMEKQR